MWVGTRVLIVDDHPAFRTIARELLEDAGYVVVGEADGVTSALLAVTSEGPDVVLLDVQLPDGSGIDLAERLARLADAPRVILISTRAQEDYGARVRDCGASGFITKSRLSAAALASVLG